MPRPSSLVRRVGSVTVSCWSRSAATTRKTATRPMMGRACIGSRRDNPALAIRIALAPDLVPLQLAQADRDGLVARLERPESRGPLRRAQRQHAEDHVARRARELPRVALEAGARREVGGH